ncbi:hypothetical protein [uncultured Pontibacter sp.]|uniref:hypothetical protein n=1 Tax=uncultured Pontibacter sp. TaxID=453356 RepID=UPI00262E8D5E|nr:hypothetical protein [uncultured Pontibacter sp.]
MKSKHEIEEHFFNKLKELYPEIPEGKVSRPEPPDFIIETDAESIAVEITQIHNEKGLNDKFPPAQKHATEDLILENARNLFSTRVGLSLHISIAFTNNLILDEKQRHGLSDHICEIVEREVYGRNLDEYFSFHLRQNLPKELIRVSGYYSPNVVADCWFSAKGKLVPNLTKREILNVIRTKERKMKRYLNKVDKAILVIAEGIIPNSWYDGIESFEQNEFVSQFHKVFIIRYLSDQLIELK